MPEMKTISLLKLKIVTNHSPERIFCSRKQEKIKHTVAWWKVVEVQARAGTEMN